MKLLIVEDSDTQRDGLKNIIETAFDDAFVYTAASYDEAVGAACSTHMDIFLLDINLGEGKSGLDVCAYIRSRKQYSETPVIFITDISAPNPDVINRYHCAYYFPKPYGSSDVINAIRSACSQSEDDSFIQLRDIQGIYARFLPDELVYVRISGHHRHLYTTGGDFIVTSSVYDGAVAPVCRRLIRCHRNFLVNSDCIRTYDKANSYLHTSGISAVIPVGRKYKADLESLLEG